MNPEPVFVRHTLLDLIRNSGSHGTFAVLAALALLIVGIVLLLVRPNLRLRGAHFIACLLPCISGVTGSVTRMMSAFSTLGTSGVGDGFKFFAAMGEIVLPMMFGFIGSAIALMMAALVWIRADKEAPPPLPH